MTLPVGVIEGFVDVPDLVDQVGLGKVCVVDAMFVTSTPVVVGRGRDSQGRTGRSQVVAFGLPALTLGND